MTDNDREARVLDAVVTLVDSLLHDFDVVDLLTDLTQRCADLLDVSSAGLLLADLGADGSVGSVMTAMPPAARMASAISSSAQATATGPISASRARSSTCRIMARPAMSASGLPGKREDAMREGMTMMGVTIGRSRRLRSSSYVGGGTIGSTHRRRNAGWKGTVRC